MQDETPGERRLTQPSSAFTEPSGVIAPSYGPQQLETNESQLELAADAAGIGLWSLDLDTYVFWSNEHVRRIFSFPDVENITYEQFLDRVHPDDIHIIHDGMNSALQEGKNPFIEYRIQLPDGTIRWVGTRGELRFCVSKQASCLMGASADITERKLREEALVRQLQFEVLLGEISTTFTGLMRPSDVDSQIERVLRSIMEYFRVDRCGFIKLDVNSGTAIINHAVYRNGFEVKDPHLNQLELFPWSFSKAAEGCSFHFSSLDELPPEAEVDRQTWKSRGVTSLLYMPFYCDETCRYMFVLSSLSGSVCWPPEIIPRIQLIGEMFVSALLRKKAGEELQQSYEEISKLKDKLEIEADYLRAEVRAAQSHDEIIGQSEPIRRVLEMVDQVAPTSSTVLVCGETGTGKELIAQAIHNNSPRRDKMMVKVNCASLPPSLVESELFGRERGAYTGAMTRQIGRFELADGSTLFLDEISELSLDLQAKLLRVLQEGEFERLGSPRTIKVDVRLIAATNRNLLEEVKQGKFREDLYYRLNVFPITLPPLRDRRPDIPMLVWEFVRQLNEKMGRKITRIAKKEMTSLQSYSWPGNIRELRNIIEYAAIISPVNELKVRLPESDSDRLSHRTTLREVEISHIEDILRQTGWRIKGAGGAAQILGMNPATLYSRMKKLGISSQREKDGMSS
jgi:PAS domain S-box-containing protein